MAYVKIDSGRTHLPVCSCGWRGIPVMRLDDARAQAAAHQAARHEM